MTILIAILSLITGFAVGFLIAYSKSAGMKRENAVICTRNEELAASLEDTKRRAEEDLAKVSADKESQFQRILTEKQSAYDTALASRDRNHRESLDAQERMHKDALETLKRQFDETVAKLKAELELRTSDMLKARQSEFETSSKKTLEMITGPLNVSLQEIKKVVSDNTEKHAQLGGQLSENIKQVIVQADATRRSADHLANVLRAGAKVQGNFGEVILGELLKTQGLVEGRHYHTQCVLQDADGSTIISETGHRLQPDLVFHLDADRDVIVDAKVSLTAFLDYANAEDEAEKAVALQKHIESIENHVKELASKGYSDYKAHGRNSVGFVIMFVPYSAALRLAMESKPSLWRDALDRNVYIADEESLFAALKIISLTWRQMEQAKNHERVYELANEMVDRVQAFLISFMEIKTGLQTADNAYDAALRKLQDNGQSIPGTCKKLLKLGARLNTKRKKTPMAMLDNSEEGEANREEDSNYEHVELDGKPPVQPTERIMPR